MRPFDEPKANRRRVIEAALAASALVGGSAVAETLAPPITGAKTAMIPVAPNARLWCWDTGGAGEAIVLLHPMTGSGLSWAYQQPAFVRAGYRVIGYSRRGHTNSDPVDPADPGTGAGDLAALLDALGVKRFHAVASAAGAFVAADFAVSHPGRVRTLTLASSILGVKDPAIVAMNTRLRVEGFEAMPASFRELSPSFRAANPDGTAVWSDIERRAHVGAVRGDQPMQNALTLSALAATRTPILLIGGDSDLIAPPPVLRAFAVGLPGADLRVLPEAGHAAFWEKPEAFNAAVLAFIRRSVR